MKTLFPAFLLAAAIAPLHAQQPDAAEMIRRIRLSATLEQMDLHGVIRKDGLKDVPVSLFIRENNMQFMLANAERFHIRMGDEQATLMTVDGQGGSKPFPASKLTQRISGTDVTYEDLTLRFLYWPNARLEGEEKIRGADCYKIRLDNPRPGVGAFAAVYVWVHKKYGAFWQIRAHDKQGRALKEFQVNSVMQIPGGKGYTIEEMLVNTLNADLRVVSQTRLTFEKPRAGAKPFRRR